MSGDAIEPAPNNLVGVETVAVYKNDASESRWFVTTATWDYAIPGQRATMAFPAGVTWYGPRPMILAGQRAKAIRLLEAAPAGWKVGKDGRPYQVTEDRP